MSKLNWCICAYCVCAFCSYSLSSLFKSKIRELPVIFCVCLILVVRVQFKRIHEYHATRQNDFGPIFYFIDLNTVRIAIVIHDLAHVSCKTSDSVENGCWLKWIKKVAKKCNFYFLVHTRKCTKKVGLITYMCAWDI